MPDISYTRTFSHDDWIDNQDVVQAEGDGGFNEKFHAIEDELDTISGVVGTIDDEIKRIQRLDFLSAEAGLTVAAGGVSSEFEVEIYDRSSFPPNVEKVYFVAIFPISGPTHVQHTILYRPLPGNNIRVTVQFFNPGAAQARFNYRVMTLAGAS
jgi:hypothetical protein